MRPDLCAVDNPNSPRSYLGRFYLDSLVHDADALRTLIAPGRRRAASRWAPIIRFRWARTSPGRLIESLTDCPPGNVNGCWPARRWSSWAWMGRRLRQSWVARPEVLRRAYPEPGFLTEQDGPFRSQCSQGLHLMADGTPVFEPRDEFARHLDARSAALLSATSSTSRTGPTASPPIYFCGHSLGLQPGRCGASSSRSWTTGHARRRGPFRGRTPWYSYHDCSAKRRPPGRRLPGEVVLMNSLTVNLHLMLVTFYRPTPDRHRDPDRRAGVSVGPVRAASRRSAITGSTRPRRC